MKVLYGLVAVLFYSVNLMAADNETLSNKLKEAQDYLSLAPSKTSSILTRHFSEVHKLPMETQLDWHQTHLRAAIALSDLTQVERSAAAMLAFGDLTAHKDKYISLLSSLGILMRRMGYSQDSITLFDCGLKKSDLSVRQQLSLLVSKGHSLRQLGRETEALALYQQSLKLAQKHQQKTLESTVYNALGNWTFDHGKFEQSKTYFLKGLNLSQQIARRYGQMFSGLQLLTIAVIENDQLLYQRLFSPVKRLVLSSQNQDRKAHLFWLEMANKVVNKQVVSNNEKQQLEKLLKQIQEVKLHNRLVKHFASLLQVEAELKQTANLHYQGKLMQQFTRCQTASN